MAKCSSGQMSHRILHKWASACVNSTDPLTPTVGGGGSAGSVISWGGAFSWYGLVLLEGRVTANQPKVVQQTPPSTEQEGREVTGTLQRPLMFFFFPFGVLADVGA